MNHQGEELNKVNCLGIFVLILQEFISTVKQEPLARSLLHLAICITNTVLEESAMELLAPGGDKQENAGDQREDKETKPPPKKGTL